MDNPTTTTRSHTAKTPRRWVPAVVAATIVVLVGGGALLLVGDGESPELTPIEIAEAYIEARNAYDPVRARELLAEDFRTGEPPDGFTDLTNLELAFEFHEVLGVQNSQGECNRQTATPEQAVVACSYMWTTELHRISGDPPTPARFTFTVRDGRISRVTHRASYATFSSWYGNFLSEHPEFREVVDKSTVLDPEGIREFKELLPQYLDLYEEWLNSQESASLAGPPIEIAEAYIEARNAYDAERARELVADDFTTGEHPDGWVDVTGIELGFETHRAYGFHYSDVDCTLGDETSQGISVACDYLWTTELHRIGNHPPTRERLTLIIEDGRIQRASRTGGSLQFWFQFYDFIVSEQPEFKAVVDLSAQELDPEAVRELGELLPQYLDLYEEWLDSQESASPAGSPLAELPGAYIEVRVPDAGATRSELPLLEATTNALVVTTRPEEPIRLWPPNSEDEWLRDGNVMTFVYVDRREVIERPLPELVFGASGFAQLLAGDRLVFFGATEIYAIDPDPAAEPEPILAMSSDTIMTPSGVPDRIWVFLGTLSGPDVSRLLQIDTHGEILADSSMMDAGILTAGLPTLAVFGSEIWDPVENHVVHRLPGGEWDSVTVITGSDADHFAWCDDFPCKLLSLTDLGSGTTRVLAQFAEGVRFRGENAGLSPDGRYLAAPICIHNDRLCALAVLDLEADQSWTVADGWLDLFLDRTPVWSPDGRWVFFQLNDGRVAAYRTGDTQAQVVDVPALDPAVGFAVVLVPDGS